MKIYLSDADTNPGSVLSLQDEKKIETIRSDIQA